MAKTAAFIAVPFTMLGLAILVYISIFTPKRDCATSSVNAQAAIGGPFTLVNQHGQTVTDQQIIDGLSLIYFGYTFCPDICSIDVGRNVSAVELAQTQGLDVTPIFISFDPKRDTASALADYAEAYHPDMIALSGSEEQIDAAVKAYRVYYRNNGETPDYLFDHSSFTYLVDQNGFLEFFRRDSTPAEMVRVMQCFASI